MTTMNITQDIITDLYPLYAEQECSTDTRALVEAYLRAHPEQAAELRRTHQTPLGGAAVRPPRDLGETRALQQARRELRRRSWLMGMAIFFTGAPCAFVFEESKITWFFQFSPAGAVMFAVAGAVCWAFYAANSLRSRTL